MEEVKIEMSPLGTDICRIAENLKEFILKKEFERKVYCRERTKTIACIGIVRTNISLRLSIFN